MPSPLSDRYARNMKDARDSTLSYLAWAALASFMFCATIPQARGKACIGMCGAHDKQEPDGAKKWRLSVYYVPQYLERRHKGMKLFEA